MPDYGCCARHWQRGAGGELGKASWDGSPDPSEPVTTEFKWRTSLASFAQRTTRINQYGLTLHQALSIGCHWLCQCFAGRSVE